MAALAQSQLVDAVVGLDEIRILACCDLPLGIDITAGLPHPGDQGFGPLGPALVSRRLAHGVSRSTATARRGPVESTTARPDRPGANVRSRGRRQSAPEDSQDAPALAAIEPGQEVASRLVHLGDLVAAREAQDEVPGAGVDPPLEPLGRFLDRP